MEQERQRQAEQERLTFEQERQIQEIQARREEKTVREEQKRLARGQKPPSTADRRRITQINLDKLMELVGQELVEEDQALKTAP